MATKLGLCSVSDARVHQAFKYIKFSSVELEAELIETALQELGLY